MTQSKNWSQPDRGNWGTTHCVDQHLLENHSGSGGLVLGLNTVIWLAGWGLHKICYICLMFKTLPGNIKQNSLEFSVLIKLLRQWVCLPFPTSIIPGESWTYPFIIQIPIQVQMYNEQFRCGMKTLDTLFSTFHLNYLASADTAFVRIKIVQIHTYITRRSILGSNCMTLILMPWVLWLFSDCSLT